MGLIRILFLSDTHLGFDSPARPRVERRRRGPDFFANFERALEPAKKGDVDLVVHGGDILYRSRVRAALVERAFRPLKAVAELGIFVYVVPGNHERSKIPYGLLAKHERLHLFDRPRTYVYEQDGFRLALAGFPYLRNVRRNFQAVLEDTGFRSAGADATLLVIHHSVEGARVGPGNFTFRNGSDVIPAAEIPKDVTAVLSGHIHRAQALTRGLAAPVLYPGSVERTSFAEKDEKKGYLTLAIETEGPTRGNLRGWKFHELPARPMVQVKLTKRELLRADLAGWLQKKLATFPRDSVVQLRIDGDVPGALSAASLRALAPSTMNVSVSLTAARNRRAYRFPESEPTRAFPDDPA